MNNNILICGVGGQGIVLASKLIALSAMDRGLMARSAETIGMSQRGGSVVSHVRIGDEVHSPMISTGQADLILGFEPGEAQRCLPYLKPDGAIVVCRQSVVPVTASLGMGNYEGEKTLSYLQQASDDVILVDAATLCRIVGSPKVLNTIMLGAAVRSGKLALTLDELERAIRTRLPEKFQQMNLTALHLGAEQEEII